MKKENVILMKEARETLTGKWGLAVSGSFLYLLMGIVIGGMGKLGNIISLIITGPMTAGMFLFFLSISRGKETSVSQLFDGFNKFKRSFIAYFITIFFILLWSLLLIVPGIIAALSYSQIYFILADDPLISAKEALEKSKKMMDGNKKKLFFLSFRFLGWALLSMLTFGIGFLWLMPYMQVTYAKFYQDVSGKSNS